MNVMTTRTLPTSIWWNPFTVERVNLTTSLSADECLQRIRVNCYSLWRGTDRSSPFVGRVRRHRFTIKKNTPYFKNDLRPIAYGAVCSDPVSGSTISIRLSLMLFVRLWWGILLGGFAVAFLLSFLGAAGIFEITPSLSEPRNVFIAAIVVAIFSYPSYVFACFISRREREFLIECLQQILEATVIYPL